MVILKIDSDESKAHITRTILEALPDWFGIPESTEEYIADSMGKPFSVRMMETGQWDFSI